VIVLDTTILVYAVGADHELREPCRVMIDAIGSGRLGATTTVDVIQEFAHVRARRRDRRDAATHARAYAELLSPLIVLDRETLEAGLSIFERSATLGAFDAMIAAAALSVKGAALVTADSAFRSVRGLRCVEPGTAGFDELLLLPD
jgi:hypothetical protein